MAAMEEQDSTIGSAPPPLTAIDRLAARFEQNSEVSSVVMVAIEEFLNGSGSGRVAPVVPIWGSYGRHGGVRAYPLHKCEELEDLRTRNVYGGTVWIETCGRRGRPLRFEVNPTA